MKRADHQVRPIGADTEVDAARKSQSHREE